ncbi:hypothetical protein FA15DRAFT_661772 [Coprinopsis marcescibilis]|uniref:Uncharacterized protein n=1 Tax=Coprinopsis marcescibilis TaxID=230819 RepID=A0A5C3KAH6_COPMA|nr:hypothetical protein FA15DRAFT_661772 [Coprinopsis marcescibilis]
MPGVSIGVDPRNDPNRNQRMRWVSMCGGVLYNTSRYASYVHGVPVSDCGVLQHSVHHVLAGIDQHLNVSPGVLGGRPKQSLRVRDDGKGSSGTKGQGQTVRYKPISGREADRNVQASEDDPRYEMSSLECVVYTIENSNTGKLSAIYEKNILGSA